MRLNLTKKIGGGFAVLIIFTCIVSYIAINAMYSGIRVSEDTASDSMPKLVALNGIQGNLLLGSYQTRVFFETGDAESFQSGQDYLKKTKQFFDEFTKLNDAYPEDEGNAFEESFSKLYAVYLDATQQGFDISRKTDAATQEMLKSAGVALGMVEKLVSTMGETQRTFLEEYNMAAVAQYSHNIVDMSAIGMRVQNVQRELLLAEGHRDIKAFKELAGTLAGIDADAKKIRERLLREECRQMFDEAAKSFASFGAAVNELIAFQIRSAELNKERVDSYNAAYNEAAAITDFLSRHTIEDVQGTYRLLSGSTKVVVGAVVVILLLGILLAFIITRMITGPLARTQKFAQAVAQGDLDRELDVVSSDETGMLADDLRLMVSNLKQKIAEANQKTEEAREASERAQVATAHAQEAVKRAENARRDGMISAAGNLEGSVNIISSASVELSAQIEHSTQNAQEVAQRLQEVATAMNEMTATVQEVARNASTASTMSAQAREQAIKGKDVVRRSLKSTQTLHSLSVKLKSDMSDLQEKTAAITGIMSVISDIADQTNLLALNAAIEAARAGEAGRGFAVVADEVRKLAEKTMTSTADVEKAISAINVSMNESLHAVETAVNQIETSTELASQAEQSLESIVRDAENAANEIQSIATASEEQSATSDEINNSINNVNELTSRSSAAMSECAQAVSELARQSQELNTLVENMKAG